MNTATELKKILVVDDEADVRTYLSRLFEQNGYACTLACDGADALAQVQAGKPNLITLDMSMPNKSGVKFYRELRADPDLADIPVVVVTGVIGQGGASDTKRFLESRKQVPPPNAFIPKPVDRDELLAAVARLI